MPCRRLVPFPLLMVLVACATTSRNVPEPWMSVPRATLIRTVALDTDGRVTHTPSIPAPGTVDGTIHVVTDKGGSRIANGLEVIAGPFPAIESLDHSAERGEVAFSALREDDFDIALVASDGSAINWMPDDPADEVAVQWAPKGNKISYVIRAAGGDVVRTLHIPTSFQFAIPFENATIRALAWDPEGAKYAVAYSTPEASDRVEVLAYDGTPRTMLVAPSDTLDVDIEPVDRHTLLLRPKQLAYDEKLPVVVWEAEDFGWSDARAALMRAGRVAVAITTRPASRALWEKLGAMPWIDASRAYQVGGEGEAPANTIVIAPDPALDAGRYTREGNRVSAAPAVVQSLAARFIAGDLERTAVPNGRRR